MKFQSRRALALAALAPGPIVWREDGHRPWGLLEPWVGLAKTYLSSWVVPQGSVSDAHCKVAVKVAWSTPKAGTADSEGASWEGYLPEKPNKLDQRRGLGRTGPEAGLL